MYSKFIKLIVVVSLLVCCGFAGRVLYGHLSQECRTRKRSISHFGVRSGIIFPWSFSSCITQTQRRNTLILGISMTEEKADYEETPDEEKASDLTFDQRLQLLQLERQVRIEEREAEREKREYERQIERGKLEYERQKAREEEERLVREEERL